MQRPNRVGTVMRHQLGVGIKKYTEAVASDHFDHFVSPKIVMASQVAQGYEAQQVWHSQDYAVDANKSVIHAFAVKNPGIESELDHLVSVVGSCVFESSEGLLPCGFFGRLKSDLDATVEGCDSQVLLPNRHLSKGNHGFVEVTFILGQQAGNVRPLLFGWMFVNTSNEAKNLDAAYNLSVSIYRQDRVVFDPTK